MFLLLKVLNHLTPLWSNCTHTRPMDLPLERLTAPSERLRRLNKLSSYCAMYKTKRVALQASVWPSWPVRLRFSETDG
ncbi:hypothetical protein C7C56_000630 [Massilia glaciei]|uniref:Uncharacterized protein n=1 Tax=Massilia glaciei TaxID=1524097 RepID=A0A2U2I7D3_9BURK|nr:hypothetical protein C7C56_000630 [Massilia glaciei]